MEKSSGETTAASLCRMPLPQMIAIMDSGGSNLTLAEAKKIILERRKKSGK